MTISKEYKEAIHGNKWKYAVLAFLLLVFIVLFELLILSVSVDPVIPVLILIAILLLIPVAVFAIDLYFCEV